MGSHCPTAVMVVYALCLLFKKGGEVEVHAKEKGSDQREKVCERYDGTTCGGCGQEDLATK